MNVCSLSSKNPGSAADQRVKSGVFWLMFGVTPAEHLRFQQLILPGTRRDRTRNTYCTRVSLWPSFSCVSLCVCGFKLGSQVGPVTFSFWDFGTKSLLVSYSILTIWPGCRPSQFSPQPFLQQRLVWVDPPISFTNFSLQPEDAMSGDAQAHLVDLDDALITWAMDKLGSDYTVEKVDASKVRPPPTYHLLPHPQLHCREGRCLQGTPTYHLSPPTAPPTTQSRRLTPPRYAHRLHVTSYRTPNYTVEKVDASKVYTTLSSFPAP